MRDVHAAVVTPVTTDLDADVVHEVIGNERRRLTLRVLDGQAREDAREEPVLTVADVVDSVATVEAGCRRGELPATQRRRVYVALTQTHLPVLDDHGVVTYHDRPQKVTVESAVEPLVGFLDAIATGCSGDSHTPEWTGDDR